MRVVTKSCGTPLEDCGRGFARLLALPRLELPGFAFGYAVAGFIPDRGSRTKPGGAERDRTDDLLNAIRRAVVDPD